jgi:hypothetical protein
MGFGIRALNALTNAGMITFSAILPVYPDSIGSLKNIGAKTVTEIQERVEYYLEKLQPIVAAYCAGTDTAYEEVRDVMYTDEYITGKILESFKNSGFAGLSFQQMRATLPEEIRESRIKKCIGSLIADNQLEYVDFRCYRVYPSVFEHIPRRKCYSRMCRYMYLFHITTLKQNYPPAYGTDLRCSTCHKQPKI